MSYVEGGYRRPVWIPIVVGIVMFFVFFNPAGCVHRMEISRPDGMAKHMLTDRETGPIFVAMKQHYPDEFNALAQQAASKVDAGAGTKELAAFTLDFILAAQQRHLQELVQAPPTELATTQQADTALIAELRTSAPKACASYAAQGALSGEGLTEKARSLITQVNVTRWRASAAGRDHPVGYKKEPLPQADAEALFSAMSDAGITEGDLKRFRDQTDPRLWPAQSQCDIPYHLYQAIGSLPAVQADRVRRWLIA